MSKKDKILAVVISVLLVAVITLIIVIIFMLNSNRSAASGSQNNSSQSENNSQSDDKGGQSTVSDNSIVTFDPDTSKKPEMDNSLPAKVEIKPQKDPETGKNKGIVFPYKIEGYNLVIEKLSGYNGIYVEDGTNTQVNGVAALLVRNDGDYPIEYAEITVEYENETLQFNISALGKGEKAVVQEQNKKAVPTSTALKGNTLIVRRADMEMSENTVSVTDNGDGSITVTNLTDKTIPTVRVFYKYYMKDEDLFVGGIAFSARITRLGANAKTVIHPAHYSSESGRVVMVSTYDS